MNSPCRVGQNFLKTLMSKEVPDPNATTKTSLSLILAAKLPGNLLVYDTSGGQHTYFHCLCVISLITWRKLGLTQEHPRGCF